MLKSFRQELKGLGVLHVRRAWLPLTRPCHLARCSATDSQHRDTRLSTQTQTKGNNTHSNCSQHKRLDGRPSRQKPAPPAMMVRLAAWTTCTNTQTDGDVDFLHKNLVAKKYHHQYTFSPVSPAPRWLSQGCSLVPRPYVRVSF